jgi:large subunit ribosomal protein L21
MYAVIKAGGKQHRVKAGDVIEVELTHGQEGETLEFKPLLVVDDDGKAHHGKDVARAVVLAKLAGEQKGDKVKVFKYRPKTGYARRQGHRQLMTLLEIQGVSLEGKRPAAKKATTANAEPETAPAKADAGGEKAPKRTTRTTARSRTTQG